MAKHPPPHTAADRLLAQRAVPLVQQLPQGLPVEAAAEVIGLIAAGPAEQQRLQRPAVPLGSQRA